MLFFINFHTYLANYVQLRYFGCLKSLLRLLYLPLKVVSARPMYSFMSFLTALVTVASCSSCNVKYSPLKIKLLIQSLEWLFHNFSETHHFTDHTKNNWENPFFNRRTSWQQNIESIQKRILTLGAAINKCSLKIGV